MLDCIPYPLDSAIAKTFAKLVLQFHSPKTASSNTSAAVSSLNFLKLRTLLKWQQDWRPSKGLLPIMPSPKAKLNWYGNWRTSIPRVELIPASGSLVLLYQHISVFCLLYLSHHSRALPNIRYWFLLAFDCHTFYKACMVIYLTYNIRET